MNEWMNEWDDDDDDDKITAFYLCKFPSSRSFFKHLKIL